MDTAHIFIHLLYNICNTQLKDVSSYYSTTTATRQTSNTKPMIRNNFEITVHVQETLVIYLDRSGNRFSRGPAQG